MEGTYDVVFLFTKQLANADILPKLVPHLHENSTVCTLQNGVPEPFVAQYVGQERTVGGTVLWGATFLEPGVSELTQDITKSDHLFEIGEIDGTIGERIKMVASLLETMGPTHVSGELMDSRWGKLVNNACMSGMSAVCGCTFGEVLDNPVSRACLSYIGNEVKLCCEAEGYRLPPLLSLTYAPDCLAIKDQAEFDFSQQMFLDMYEGLRPAKASMLQDLEKNRPTEVRMIDGYVCQTGDKHGIDTPFCDKVVEIVERIGAGELPLSMDNLKEFAPEMFRYELYKA
jgi:2-dehydropantoate 2-reductase